MEEWIVYKHTTPSGKVYIGITHQKPTYRWRNGEGYNTNTHFYSAILKYGWDNIKHEIVQVCHSQEEAESLERNLIFQYKSYDKRKGYNKALGGHALSEESRKKISETRKERGIPSPTLGKHLSEETRRKISESLIGRKLKPPTEETRRRKSEAKRGEKNPNYGKPMPEDKKAMLIALHSTPVIQICEDKEVYFGSAKLAGDATGICNSNISRVCAGGRVTAGGYRWRYATEAEIKANC